MKTFLVCFRWSAGSFRGSGDEYLVAPLDAEGLSKDVLEGFREEIGERIEEEVDLEGRKVSIFFQQVIELKGEA